MSELFVEPCDVVFFRDDMPFGAAGTQIGRCQFPPRPSVIAGALRTKALASAGVDFDAFREDRGLPETVRREIGHGRPDGDGHAHGGGSFALVALHLGRRDGTRDTACHRAGRDLVRPRARHGGPVALHLLSPAASGRMPGIGSLGALTPLSVVPDAKPEEGWLDEAVYVRYLAGEPPAATEVIAANAVRDRDNRVGIALGPDTRTVDEGRLFSSEGVVLREGWGFVAGVEGCSLLPREGLIRLGGDGRMARLSPWAPPPVDWGPVRASIERERRFRLILRTPAIFERGWHPGTPDGDGTPVLRCGAVHARLVSAAVGAPELAGGWDLVRRGPKPFRLMAPAGSVYWFELIEGSGADVWGELQGKSISDERAAEGFGLVHVGGWAHV